MRCCHHHHQQQEHYQGYNTLTGALFLTPDQKPNKKFCNKENRLSKQMSTWDSPETLPDPHLCSITYTPVPLQTPSILSHPFPTIPFIDLQSIYSNRNYNKKNENKHQLMTPISREKVFHSCSLHCMVTDNSR